jgi:ribonuclease Z
MKFTFLGTSAGTPTKKRNVSALAFEMDNEKGWYLFDCGEATQHQILKTNYSLNRLKTVFITHLHGDHIYGLFGVITSRMLNKSTEPLTIYGPKGLREIITAAVDVSFEHLGYELEFIEVYAGFEESFENFDIKVLPLIHSIESYAYFIQEKEKISLNAQKLKDDGLMPSPHYQKIKDGNDIEINGKIYKSEDYVEIKKGRKIIIAGDNAEPDILGKYLKNLDLLIHEATYTQSVYDSLETKYLHTTAKNLALACEYFGVKNLIATHISPRFEGGEILSEIKEYYKGNAFVANDFDTYVLYDDKIKKEGR